MRICEVVRIWPTHRLGGMPLHALTLCRGLVRRGHEVHVLTTSHAQKKETEVEEGIVVHYIKGTPTGTYSGQYSQLGRELFTKLHKEKPFDVIHSESSAAQFLFEAPVPKYMTLHGIGMDSMQTDINFAYKHRSDKVKAAGFLKKAADSVQKYFDDCLMFHKFTGIIAISDAVYDDLIVRLHVPRKRVHLIYNGIDETHFKPGYVEEAKRLRAQLKIAPNDKVILTLSMLQKYKGIDDIIKALPQIAKEVPNVRLVIAGDGEDGDNLKKLARTLQVDIRINFVGVVAEKFAPHYYNMCDLFFNGSLHHSGLDLTLQEAAACAKPIVACDVGSKARTIVKENIGTLYALDDIDGVAKAVVEHFKQKPGNREENAYKLFVQQFTLTQMISKVENLFKKGVSNV